MLSFTALPICWLIAASAIDFKSVAPVSDAAAMIVASSKDVVEAVCSTSYGVCHC